MTTVCDDKSYAEPCRGHRKFDGGPLDGHVDHLVLTTPSDFPLTYRYPDGAFYERDLDRGAEAVYRWQPGEGDRAE